MAGQPLQTGDPLAGGPGRGRDRRVLEGAELRLAPLSEVGDISEELFACSHGDGASVLWTYMAYGPFSSCREMADWLDQQARAEDPVSYAVFDRSRRRHAGMASFVNLAPEMRRLEIGDTWLSPEVHRTKVATELAFLMLRHGLEDLESSKDSTATPPGTRYSTRNGRW